MSRSTQLNIENPVTRHFEWAGSEGQFKYYDKDKEEKVTVKTPFQFLILDDFSGVGGFSDTDKSGIWSNEVKSLANEPLTVRTRKGEIVKGLYADIKGKFIAEGGKYAKILYVAYYEGKELKIGSIKMVGACVSAFIDFSKENNVKTGVISCTGSKKEKKGATTYYTPKFEFEDATADQDEIAMDLDKELQAYFAERSKVSSNAAPEVTQIELPKADIPEAFQVDNDETGLPF